MARMADVTKGLMMASDVTLGMSLITRCHSHDVSTGHDNSGPSAGLLTTDTARPRPVSLHPPPAPHTGTAAHQGQAQLMKADISLKMLVSGITRFNLKHPWPSAFC